MLEDPLIVALDQSPFIASGLFAELTELGIKNFKIRNRMFWRDGGRALARLIVDSGNHLMVDCKDNDTRDSIEGDVKCLFQEVGARWITVTGNEDVMEAAMRAKPSGPSHIVLASTALTDRAYRNGYLGMLDRSIQTCDGITCPAVHLATYRAKTGARRHLSQGKILMTPGIRPTGWDPGDHQIYISPRGAMLNGADYIIVGRPIYTAHSPKDAARAIMREIAGVEHV